MNNIVVQFYSNYKNSSEFVWFKLETATNSEFFELYFGFMGVGLVVIINK